MHMTMTHRGDCMLMLHGAAFVSGVVQSGPRGGGQQAMLYDYEAAAEDNSNSRASSANIRSGRSSKRL
jgi:hypothetical protein